MEKDWEKAKKHLDDIIHLYEGSMQAANGIRTSVDMPLQLYLWPLRRRYDAGERSDELYNKMINAR